MIISFLDCLMLVGRTTSATRHPIRFVIEAFFSPYEPISEWNRGISTPFSSNGRHLGRPIPSQHAVAEFSDIQRSYHAAEEERDSTFAPNRHPIDIEQPAQEGGDRLYTITKSRHFLKFFGFLDRCFSARSLALAEIVTWFVLAYSLG